MTDPGARLNCEAAQALAIQIKESMKGSILLPAAKFWTRMGLDNPTVDEQAWLAEQFRIRHFNFISDSRRDAVYIEWPWPTPAGKAAADRKDRHDVIDMILSEPDSEQAMASMGVPNRCRNDFLRAVSVPQPHAELILRGELDSLQRRWAAPCPFGAVLLHASSTWTKEHRQEAQRYGLAKRDLSFGAIVGTVEVVDESGYDQKYVWKLAKPRRFAQPVQVAGSTGEFSVPGNLVASQLWQEV